MRICAVTSYAMTKWKEDFGEKKIVEWIGKVEAGEEFFFGSRRSMHVYILT